MFRNLFLKTIFNLRWQLLGWSLAILFVVFITMSTFNSFSQGGVEEIVDSVPDSLKSLIGSIADFNTIPGFIGQQIFGPNVVILTIIMSILLFVSVSANEEDRGGLQTILSLPLSRTSVFVQKWLAVVGIIAVVCLAIAVGIGIGLLAVDKSADWQRIFESVLACWLMNTAYGVVAYAVAMGTGKKALTVAVASGYAFISFIISSLASSVDKLSLVDKFSIFHYYNNPQIMSNGLDWHAIFILLTVIITLTTIGWIGFLRRDIRG